MSDQESDMRRRRSNASESGTAGALRKRARHNIDEAVVDNPSEKEEADNVDAQKGPILHWTTTGHWPEGYFKESDMNLFYLYARPRSSGYLGQSYASWMEDRKRCETPTLATPSDEKPREVKSAPYLDPGYETLLENKRSFMHDSPLGPTQTSKENYLHLLDARQTTPKNSLFSDELFRATCKNLQDKNEGRIIRDISQLIVPSAEILATRGAKSLDILAESVNEGWKRCASLTGTRPQPDLSVGFKMWAFTKEQLGKLDLFTGDVVSDYQSYFRTTYYMFFPFLTCEVKCGATALDIADRHNAHCATLAVRAVVELFRLVGREMELNREILAFSISHDHRSVRIYGHYPVIDGKDIGYYRHLIRAIDVFDQDGRERWTAHKFVKNVYEIWMPNHFKLLCSAIDQIPADLDFSVSSLPESFGDSQEPSPQITDGTVNNTSNISNTSFTG